MQYFTLFITFFKIGLFTFGGGYAMIPMIEYEVISKGWIDFEMLVDFIAISESTPGPFAVNLATFIGMEQGSLFGAFCATLGVILPSFIIILIIAKCFAKFKENKYVKNALCGLRPAVVGLIMAAAFSILIQCIYIKDTGFNLQGIVIIILLLIINKIKKLSPITIICISALLGILLSIVGI